MTDKHDFKAVLEDMSERMPYGKNTDETLAGHFATDNYEAIQAALKLIQTYEQRTRRYDHADGALYLELKQEQGTLLRVREVLNQCDEAMEYMGEYDIPIALPDNVKQALAELGALIEAKRWQPIETAPKNGTWVILGFVNALGKWRFSVGHYIRRFSEEYTHYSDEFEVDVKQDGTSYWPEGWYGYCHYEDDIWTQVQPTHWMSLPTPPENQDDQP